VLLGCFRTVFSEMVKQKEGYLKVRKGDVKLLSSLFFKLKLSDCYYFAEKLKNNNIQ